MHYYYLILLITTNIKYFSLYKQLGRPFAKYFTEVYEAFKHNTT